MSNKILSYRGLLADDTEQRILLSTKKGEKGYRIIKFEIMDNLPGQQDTKHVVQIFKITTSPSNVVDFSNNRLLAAAMERESVGAEDMPVSKSVIFDQEIFNQDIFITHIDVVSNKSCNYYLELEVIMLNETEATVATLKDIRNNA